MTTQNETLTRIRSIQNIRLPGVFVFIMSVIETFANLTWTLYRGHYRLSRGKRWTLHTRRLCERLL